MAYTRVQLAGDLRALGVRAGDYLFVHSSFKSLGTVEGGAETVIGALEDAVAVDGMVLMPSFNLTPKGNDARLAAWDILSTPSCVGYLTEAFRRLPGTARSDHFSHSVTGRGRDAMVFLSTHRDNTGMRSPWDHPDHGKAFGEGSPFHKLYKDNRGRVLMLGVDYNSSTFCHYIEVVYWNERLRKNPDAPYIWLDRDRLGVRWDEIGRVSRGPVGDSESRLFSIRDFTDTLLKEVRADPQRWARTG